MKALLQLIFCITFISCNKQVQINLDSLIDKRLDIIERSYKHSIYQLYDKSFDHVHFHARIKELISRAEISVLKQSDIDELNSFIKKDLTAMDSNNREIPQITYFEDKRTIINQLQLTELLVLDNIIFLEKNYNNNFDKLKALVCPITTDVKAGDEYTANIYLTAWDPLFEPAIKIKTPTGFLNIPVESCVGKYKCLTSTKGPIRFEGKIEVRNEMGDTANIPFRHEFIVK